ncbi:GDSL esterase/lipase At1g23500-like [Vicia villosa]|uniref:GDSL esterase/lipase At1g23500-like n=1 Tax=Vicia villosa TaxID=3911 RepID=UPI00273CE61E|nr:GDSL esterase/lipase At1g23500-like [Vicia villosa]
MKNLMWMRLVIIFLVLFGRVSNTATVAYANAVYPAVFAFGDSIFDTGNNNNLATASKCNFPPYGRDFYGGAATGRFGNGKVLSDVITAALGVKDTLPAYLDPQLTDQDLPTGVCFASGGSGLDDLTANSQGGVLTMGAQLDLFKQYIEKLRTAVGTQKAAEIISKALFIISAGNNDVAFAYSYTIRRALLFNVYADMLVDSSQNFLKSLYQLGARHVWVLSTIPLGCLPSARSIFGGPSACLDFENVLAQTFNGMLSTGVSNLKASLPDYDVKFVDVYSPMLNIITNPSTSGFENVVNGCCGTGTFEMGASCNMFTYQCPSTAAYFFWDAAHPSERAYQLTVAQLLHAQNYDLTSHHVVKSLHPLNVSNIDFNS